MAQINLKQLGELGLKHDSLEQRARKAKNPIKRLVARAAEKYYMYRYLRQAAPLLEEAAGYTKRQVQGARIDRGVGVWLSDQIYAQCGERVSPDKLKSTSDYTRELEKIRAKQATAESFSERQATGSTSLHHDLTTAKQGWGIIPAQIPGLVSAPIVGMVAGWFMFPTSTLAPVGGAVLALACVVAIVANDRR